MKLPKVIGTAILGGRPCRPLLCACLYDKSYFRDLQANIAKSMNFVYVNNFGGAFMDIMLERILSLIPHKPDGKFVHGTLRDFANKLDLKSGNVVSDWISGKSSSYKNYVYRIATIYDVSVDWLKGETDDRMPKSEKRPTDGEALSDCNVISVAGRDGSYTVKKLSDEQFAALKTLIDQLPELPEGV